MAGRRERDPAFHQQPRRAPAGRTRHQRARTISCARRSSRSTWTGIRRPKSSGRPEVRNSPMGWSNTAGTTPRITNAASTPTRPRCATPIPTVVLIPGLGLIAWGKDKSESRVTAEFYKCAVEVMRGAEAIDEYIALPQQEAFDIEYWLLEEAKLQRMPAEKELARQVHVVIGAGSGIGKEVDATAGARRRAHRRGRFERRLPRRLPPRTSPINTASGIGVAGSDISGCGPAIGLSANITDRASIRAMLRSGRACLRRIRRHRGHGGDFRAQRHDRTHPRRQVAAHV